MPPPDIELEVDSGEPGFQTGEMIKRLENVFLDSKFEIVLVYATQRQDFGSAMLKQDRDVLTGICLKKLRGY